MFKRVLAAALLAGFLSGLMPSSSFASAEAGSSCTDVALGTTTLGSNNTSIVACLRKAPGSSDWVWKNYTPENKVTSGVDSCVDGNLAIYSGGRFVCKKDGLCSNGDLLVFRGGSFICEDKSTTAIMKNYDVEYMEAGLVPTWNEIMAGQASSSFTGDEHCNNLITIKTMTYTAKSTGKLRISAVIPFRYYQASSFYGSYLTQWEETVIGRINVDNFDVAVSDIHNPDPGGSGSSGDVGQVIGVIDIVKGQDYLIRIRVGGHGDCGVDARGWAGTLWSEDHYTAGSIETIEY